MSYTNDVIDRIDDMLEQGSTSDGEPNSLTNVPEQDPDLHRKNLSNDLGGGEEYEDVDDEEVADEMDNDDELGEALNLVDNILDEQDSIYQTYFRTVMKKHGVTGIKEMSPEKKKEFFKDVSNGWKSKKKVKKEGKKIDTGGNEISEQQSYGEYKKYFKFMMQECGIEDLRALSETDQAEFISMVMEAFDIMNEQMHRPGAPMNNPMNPHSNLLGAMKKQRRPEERLSHAGAAKAMRQGATRTQTGGGYRRAI